MTLNKKRKKSSRMHGSHTHGRGFKKKGRGSGHRGGVGMAGTGKRADQKKTLILNYPESYFGKESLKAKPRRYEIINVDSIEKLAGGKKEVDLKKYKILGNGEIKIPLKISAYSASKEAIKKIKKAGGEISILNTEKRENKKSSEKNRRK